MIKTKTWILIFSMVLLLSIAASVILFLDAPDSSVVTVIQNGTVIQKIDLSRVVTPYCFTVDDPQGGYNTILVEPGRICVKEADCPDHVCIHRGWLSDSAVPIVCIPHRLVIQMEGTADVDTAAQ